MFPCPHCDGTKKIYVYMYVCSKDPKRESYWENRWYVCPRCGGKGTIKDDWRKCGICLDEV